MVVWLMFFILAFEFLVALAIKRDILSPAVVFSTVFLVAIINVLTNVSEVGIVLHPVTAFVVCGGVFAFSLSSIIGDEFFSRVKVRFGLRYGYNREICFSRNKMAMMLAFNVMSIVYILSQVYALAASFGYQGSLLGSMDVYRQQLMWGSGENLGFLVTLVTALCEAEGYVLGYILAKSLAERKRPKMLTVLCFVTAFASTFCQGNRGGLYMLIATVIEYLILLREIKGRRAIGFKLIAKLASIFIVAVAIFFITGMLAGKMWDVPLYEYFSVYMGFPTVILDRRLERGIAPSPMWGYNSFGALIRKIFPMFGLSVPSQISSNSGGFEFLNGHNLGNVATVFPALIADFGYGGMIVALILIGFFSTMLYRVACRAKRVVPVSRILYGYVLTCIAFSFFSNALLQNISFYHFVVVVFMICFSSFLSKKQKKSLKTAQLQGNCICSSFGERMPVQVDLMNRGS